MKTKLLAGAICGGVISFSQNKKLMKKYGIWADLMSYIMPDKQYKCWVTLKKHGKDKQAEKLFDRYAISQI